MKKIVPIILIIAIAAYFFMSGDKAEQVATQSSSQKSTSESSGSSFDAKQDETVQLGEDYGEEDEYEDIDIRPATEVYTSSEDAFEAVKKGAQDYDDIILEQFVEIKDCEWCGEFFDSVKEAMLKPSASEDEQSYYSEILAISGSPTQVKTLVESIKNAGDEAKADLLAESLELALGDDTVVNYLKEELSETTDPLLKESLVAAVTNQGSRLAAENFV